MSTATSGSLPSEAARSRKRSERSFGRSSWCSRNDTSAYLSLRGKARVIEDVTRIREYWKEPFRVWFPGGPSDPQLALVGVKPIDAEFWDNRGTNKLEYMFEAAKAYFSGEKPDTGDADKHGRANL